MGNNLCNTLCLCVWCNMKDKTIPERIIDFLTSHKGQPISNERVFQEGWGCDYIPKRHSNTLWVTICHARKALSRGTITQPKRGCYQYDEGEDHED